MTPKAKKTLALTVAILLSCHAQSLQAQETIAGLTVLNPRSNMYMPFEQSKKTFVEVRSRRSVQMPREYVAPVPRGEVDTQSYKVAPVPSFLIEEAMEDSARRGVQVTAAESGGNDIANLNMAEGEVKDVKEEQKKKVVHYVRRPMLWYGGPWRKG